MKILKMAHAGFNLGDIPRKLTNIVFEKIKEISLKATGNTERTPTEDQMVEASLSRWPEFPVNPELQKELQSKTPSVPYLIDKTLSEQENNIKKDSYQSNLDYLKNKPIRIVLDFTDNSYGGASFNPTLGALLDVSMEMTIFVGQSLINEFFYSDLLNKIEHELQHYAQYISNVPWSPNRTSFLDDNYSVGSEKYHAQPHELQAYITGDASQLANMMINTLLDNLDDLDNPIDKNTLLKMTEEQIANLAKTNCEKRTEVSLGEYLDYSVRHRNLSPENKKHYLHSVSRMLDKKLKEEIQLLKIKPN